MPRSFLGLGGNVGDVPATFRAALQQLAEAGVSPLHVSRWYRTAPVGPQSGNAFGNACALVETALTPHELLALIHRVEDAAGRERGVRWGPRTLDVDILGYGDLVQSDAELTLPHPGLVYRRFVLDPLAEISPQWRHPVLNRTIEELQQRLRRRPLPLLLVGNDAGLRLRVCAQMEERFPEQLRILTGMPELVGDPTMILVAEWSAIMEIFEDMGGVCARVDAQVAEHDPVAATVAIVTAMLDEPRAVGELAV